MKPQNTYTITSGLDDNYVFPFLVMAFSASKNSNNRLQFKIAYGENLLSSGNRKLIASVLASLDIPCEFIAIKLNQELKSQGHIQITAFSRLYLADNLSENFLWLDCDLICFPGWDNIFNECEPFLEKSAICAAVDAIPLQNQLTDKKYEKNMALVRMGRNYFNSGVSMINPFLWREITQYSPWEDLYKSYQKLGFQFADQCVLNYLCSNSFHHLDRSYNVYATIRKKYISNQEIRILHFPGADKPWMYRKYEVAIFLSSVKAANIFRYLAVASNLVDNVREIDSDLGSSLESLQISLRKTRSFSTLIKEQFSRFLRILFGNH